MTISAQDCFEITQLIQRYLHHGDFGHGELAAKSFAEDAEQSYIGLQVEVAHAGEQIRGRQQIAKMANELFRGAQGNCRHWAGVPLFEDTDDGLVAESYMMVLRVGQVPYAGVILTGVYRDYVRRNAAGKWEIWKRITTLDPAPEHRGKQPYDVLVVARDLVVAQLESVLAEAAAIHAAGARDASV